MTDDQPKTQFWKNFAIFMSGTLVGAVVALGGLFVWREVKLSRAEIQIKLPSENSTPVSVQSSAAVRSPRIPEPPATVRSQPASPPSPSPSLRPKPSPALAKPSPSPTLAATDRVTFEGGSTGSTIRDRLQANQSKRYLLECSGDQEMTVQIEEGVVSVAIVTPSGEKLGTAVGTIQWKGKLPSSGDYTLEISALSESNYAVKVEVQ